MRPTRLWPAAAAVATTVQPQRYLTNDEAADYLRLSPRTLPNRSFGIEHERYNAHSPMN